MIWRAGIAGVMFRPWDLSADGIESTFATNHVGHHLLAKLLLPLLQKTASKHGVATVSVASSAAAYETVAAGEAGIQLDYYLQRHSVGSVGSAASAGSTAASKSQQASTPPEWFDSFEAYCQSKLANILFAQQLSEVARADGHNVLVNAWAPGAVFTNLLNHVIGPGEELEAKLVPSLGPSAASSAREAVVWALGQLVWHPRDASLTQVYTAIGKVVREANTTGRYFQSVAREQAPDPHCRNKTLQLLLWQKTEALIAG